MKPGRNDPCPCGSGKKYKKCCLPAVASRPVRVKDDAVGHPLGSEHDYSEVAAPKAASSIQPRDPVDEARHACWERLNSAGFTDRWRIFMEAMDEPGLVDSEFAFEAVNLIAEDVSCDDDHARLIDLLATLRDRCPEAYTEEEIWVLDWWMLSALATRRDDEIERIACRFAEIADRDVDIFLRVVDRLAFWGRVHVLARVLRIAYPLVHDAGDFSGWVAGYLADMGIATEAFVAIESGHDSETLVDELTKRAELYQPAPDRLPKVAGAIAGKIDAELTNEAITAGSVESRARIIEQLGWEFLAHNRQIGAMPLTRALLSMNEIVEYLLERASGGLSTTSGGKGQRKPNRSPVPHPLCPDQDSLGRYASRRLNFINRQTYKVVALLAGLPHWLDFLGERGLLDEPKRKAGLAGVRQLSDNYKKGFDSQEPMLREAVSAL